MATRTVPPHGAVDSERARVNVGPTSPETSAEPGGIVGDARWSPSDLIEDGPCTSVAMKRHYGALLDGSGADIARRLGDFERTQEGSAHAFGSLLGHGD